MDAKTIFLNSLYDEQMGFFCAHEYSANLEELLEEELNVKQFTLFNEWKKQEMTLPIIDGNSAQDLLTAKLDRIESMLENVTARLNAIEEKPSTRTASDTASQLVDQMIGIESISKQVMSRLDGTEYRSNKASKDLIDSVTALLANNNKIEASVTMLDSRLATIENRITQKEQANEQIIRDISSLVEHNKTIEASQAMIVSVLDDIKSRMENVDAELLTNSKSLLEKMKNMEAFQEKIVIKQEMIEETVKQTKQDYKVTTVPRVSILNNHAAPGISVKKGDTLKLLDDISKLNDKDVYLVKVEKDGNIGFVPRLSCEEIKQGFKIVCVKEMEMLRDYKVLDSSVKKGDVLGLLQDKELPLVKLGDNGKTLYVPRDFCKKTGRSINVRIPV